MLLNYGIKGSEERNGWLDFGHDANGNEAKDEAEGIWDDRTK